MNDDQLDAIFDNAFGKAGGSALPVADQGVYGVYGMTLRDWFAGQALGAWRCNYCLPQRLSRGSEIHRRAFRRAVLRHCRCYAGGSRGADQ